MKNDVIVIFLCKYKNNLKGWLETVKQNLIILRVTTNDIIFVVKIYFIQLKFWGP